MEPTQLDPQRHLTPLRVLGRTDDGGTKDGSKGDIYTRICFIDKRVREMSATVAAQRRYRSTQ